MRLAHISDPHFGTEDAPVCAALHRDIHGQQPDLVVLSGDITQRARRRQFEAARAFLDSLTPIPVLAVPGNHDQPIFDLLTRFLKPYGHYRRHICPDLAPSWCDGRVAVLGVNSTRLLRHKHGNLPPEVIDGVVGRLQGVDAAFKVVVLHHPLAICQESDRANRARHADAALAAWTRAGADLFLGGHIHLAYCRLAGPGPRQGVVAQAGTATSTRRRAGHPNSYNLIHLEPSPSRRMLIEQRDYEAASGHFGLQKAYEARFDGNWLLGPA